MPDGGFAVTGEVSVGGYLVFRTAFYDANSNFIRSFTEDNAHPEPTVGTAVNSLGYFAALQGKGDLNIEVFIPGQSNSRIFKLNNPGVANSYEPSGIQWINNYTVQVAYTVHDGPGNDGSSGGIVTASYLLIDEIVGRDDVHDNLVGPDIFLDDLSGGAGNDTLNGASGPDTMHGGAGNDSYYVDNSGDVVDELTPGSDGYDTVYSWITYTLPTNVEALVLLGTANINGTGNVLDNALTGNNGANVLDGSFGKDNMRGLAGNDSYYVDVKGDVVNEIETGSDGWDTVYSTINFKLPTNVEALVMLGDLKLDGTGNGLANFVLGNIAANELSGGGANDTIRGGLGKDKIDGGGGSDTADYSDKTKALSISLDGPHSVSVKVKGRIEDSIKNIENLIGGTKGDTFKGDSKANTFDGGLGKDIFTGKGGNDHFVFSTAFGPSNVDTITDFSHKHDKIVLQGFAVLLGPVVEKTEFYAKAGATKAHDADDRLIYDKSNGNLYLDADGKGGGAAVLFAKLSNHPGSFDFHDFLIA